MNPARFVVFHILAVLLMAATLAKAPAQDNAAKEGLAAKAAGATSAPQEARAIDFSRARELFQKQQKGETLTDEEQAYIRKAKQAQQKMKGQKGGQEGKGRTQPEMRPTSSTGLIALTDMGEAKYKGEDGGLYGGGSNEPPASQKEAARKASAEIQPLDAEGKPSTDGKIVFIGVGMSNTTMEFSSFKELADKDPQKNPNLVIVDVAQGGQDSLVWADTAEQVKKGKRDVWAETDRRLKNAGVTAPQIQVVWYKQARISPSNIGEFPVHARALEADSIKTMNLLKERFPNLRVAYASNRIYAGYAKTHLNPEPYSYESSFAVRWLIQDQVNGKPELNFDPAKGAVKSPVLLWGPYLWTDGMKGRKDGLVWRQEDSTDRDGTHPTESGRKKVADMLMNLVKTDPNAKTWFLAVPK